VGGRRQERHRGDAARMTALNSPHDPARRSWIDSANLPEADFPIQNLPLGAFVRDGIARAAVAIGEHAVDLHALADSGLLDAGSDSAIPGEATRGGTLNRLMAMPPRHASALRAALSDLLKSDAPQRARMQA